MLASLKSLYELKIQLLMIIVYILVIVCLGDASIASLQGLGSFLGNPSRPLQHHQPLQFYESELPMNHFLLQ
jgi:hypothetical protein